MGFSCLEILFYHTSEGADCQMTLPHALVTPIIEPAMEITSTRRKSKIRWQWLVFVVAGAVLAAWLVKTPAGLLGKADAIGYAVCHRIDSHSFHLGARETPLCARCTGMYLGAMVGIIALEMRGRRAGMPPLKINLALGALLLAFSLDGVNSYLSLIPGMATLYLPENWLRLATGSGVGLGIAAILVPAFNQTVWRDFDERPALGSWRQFLALLALAAGVDLLVYSQNPLILYPLALLSAAQVVVLLTTVYTLVLAMAFHHENRFARWSEMAVLLAAGFTIAMLQISAIDAVRFLVTGTWAGFQL